VENSESFLRILKPRERVWARVGRVKVNPVSKVKAGLAKARATGLGAR
jgi:hypothetical protein